MDVKTLSGRAAAFFSAVTWVQLGFSTSAVMLVKVTDYEYG